MSSIGKDNNLEGEKLYFRSNGKLLITSEYLVLDGAKALALPTKKGQTLTVKKNNLDVFTWKSFAVDGSIWFEATFDEKFNVISFSDKKTAQILAAFLKTAVELNPSFIKYSKSFSVETHLEFEQSWGLGTSSTLINNIANWADINPFELQQKTFLGSGYDIACASVNSPIIYKITKNIPSYRAVAYKPPFLDKLYFVHLNKKQNSRDAIKGYRNFLGDKKDSIEKANILTEKLFSCTELSKFMQILDEHEKMISEIIGKAPVKEQLFPCFYGSVKSLGAWGGDFVLACGENVEEYFNNKGYNTIIPFKDMIL